MQARDGSTGFDFEGEFTRVALHELIQYASDDGRNVKVTFDETESGVKVTEVFEAEGIHTVDEQRRGWQSILNNFKRHVEGAGDYWTR